MLHPPHAPRTLRFLAALLIAAGLLAGSLWTATPAQAQQLSLNKSNFGSSEQVIIDFGTIAFVDNCGPGGINDFINRASDIYIVQSNSVPGIGDSLNDVSDDPNTVVTGLAGGGIIDELIGITAPNGTIGTGTYAVIYDACQNGQRDGEDTVFNDPAFTVTIPDETPTITSVEPDPVVGSDSLQPFTIHGGGFEQGANVTLRDLTNGGIFANRDISSFSPTEIVINPTFTTEAATWSVEVINPGGESTGEYQFDVVAPGEGVPVSEVPLASSLRMPIGKVDGNDLGGDLTLLERGEWPGSGYPRIRFNDDGDGEADTNEWYVATAHNEDENLTGAFGGDTEPYSESGAFHPGEDWNLTSGSNSDEGKPVLAVGDGTVLHDACVANYGRTVIVAHKTGEGQFVTSFYAHLKDTGSFRSVGQGVEAGETIGYIDGTNDANCTVGLGAHLHFEVRRESMLDPEALSNGFLDLRYEASTWPASVSPEDGGQSFIAENYYTPSEFIDEYESGSSSLVIEISGDYYGESSFTHGPSSYTDRPRPQDKLVAAVRITNTGSEIAEDIDVEGTYAGSAVDFAGYDTTASHLGDDLDANGDGRIDEIAPSESVEFLVLSQSFAANQENEVLEASVVEANGTPVSDVSAQRTVSLYFARGADDGPFTFGEDNYASNNYSIQSTETIKEVAEAAGAPVSTLTALAKLHYTQIGLCYGFSSTAGLYFQKPDQQPAEDWRYRAEEDLVADNIVDYHFYQITRPTIIGIFLGPLNTVDVGDEYATLKTRFAQSDPSLIALLDETDNGHAILATKLTEYQDESKGYIEVYDPNNTDFAALATYDASTTEFSYPFYGSSFPFFSEGPPYNLADPYIFDEFTTEPIPPEDLGSDFLDPFIAEIAELFRNTGKKLFAALITPFEGQSPQATPAVTNAEEEDARYVNLLVTDGEGRQAGHRADGTPVNEIPGVDVDRVALEEQTADSLTSSDSLSYVYVPADGEYDVSMTSSEVGGSVRFEYYHPGESNVPRVAWAEGIAFSESTVATFDDTDPSGNILVDYDGDGTVDETFPTEEEALPVELTSFEAAPQEAGVLLTWKTASETGNDGFAIERQSGESGAWTRVGFREGAGTTTEAQTYRFEDADLPYEAEALTYRLKQVDLDGNARYSEPVSVELAAPEQFTLHGSFPNPFGEKTTIRYELPRATDVRLSVYDVLGRRVAVLVNEKQEAGRKEIPFAAEDLASGTYFYRLEAGGQVLTETMVLVR